MNTPHRLAAAASGVLGLLALAGCTENVSTVGTAGSIAVTSTDRRRARSPPAEAPSGPVVFTVTNSGDQVTEFYLLGEDGLRIVAEVENIGPGLTRDLVVQAAPGSYFTACKPGMVGRRDPRGRSRSPTAVRT